VIEVCRDAFIVTRKSDQCGYSRRTAGFAFTKRSLRADDELQPVSPVESQILDTRPDQKPVYREYPHFYRQLYNLMDREVMHVKYRARFFRLSEAFLSSTSVQLPPASLCLC
jgi:hypothetical protein